MSNLSDADTAKFARFDDLLAKHFGPSPPPVAVKFGALSHPGRVRATNEDHYMVVERRRTRSVLLSNLPDGLLSPADDTAYVMAVADGMGGAACGELASMLALRSGWDQQPGAIKWSWIITDREIADLQERVEIIFRRMDQALLEQGRSEPGCAGMGTTLTGAYSVGPNAFIGHVGDSRAYLYRQGKLAQLTHDHTLAQQCLDLGLPVLSRSWHHTLVNCLGGNDQEVHVEFHHIPLEDGDRLLLCTDGLTDMLGDEAIAEIVGQDADPQKTAQVLVDRALERGGKDNVTVVVAHYAIRQ
jgi:serine/threonine protein phosphatase PrpC